jgi:hypothetical protein
VSEAVMMATIAISGVDAALAGVLLAVYVRLYRRVRASMTAGLAAVAGCFLIQNLFALASFISTIALIPDTLAPLLLVIGVLETGGLVLLLRSALD